MPRMTFAKDLVLDFFQASTAVSQATMTTLSNTVNKYLVENVHDRLLLGLVLAIALVFVATAHSRKLVESGTLTTVVANVVVFCSVSYSASLTVPTHVNEQEKLAVISMQIFFFGFLGECLHDSALQNLAQTLHVNSRIVFAGILSDYLWRIGNITTTLLLAFTVSVIFSRIKGNIFSPIIQMATSNVLKSILVKNVPNLLSIPTNLAIISFLHPLLEMNLIAGPFYEFILYKVGGDITEQMHQNFNFFAVLVIFVIVSVVSPTNATKSVAQVCVTGSVSRWMLENISSKGKGDPILTLVLFLVLLRTLVKPRI